VAICVPCAVHPLTLFGSQLASQKYPVVDEARGGPAWCHILFEALPGGQTTSPCPQPHQLRVPGGPSDLKAHSPQLVWCADGRTTGPRPSPSADEWIRVEMEGRPLAHPHGAPSASPKRHRARLQRAAATVTWRDPTGHLRPQACCHQRCDASLQRRDTLCSNLLHPPAP
jgi:hypothetical protein